MNRRIFLLLVTGGLWSVPAYSADYPTRGTLSGVKENDGLQYECTLKNSEILDCDFTQVSISRAQDASEWPSEREKVVKEFESASVQELAKQSSSMCRLADQIESQLAVKSEAASEGVTGDESNELIAQIGKLADQFCQEPSIDVLVEMTRISFERETRTCEVTINNFNQQFKKSSAGWNVISEATGECGVVQLSKFEPETEYFWKYTARKAITNPDNETAFGLSCSALDEAPYPYAWEPINKKAGCDFIRY